MEEWFVEGDAKIKMKADFASLLFFFVMCGMKLIGSILPRPGAAGKTLPSISYLHTLLYHLITANFMGCQCS